MDRIDEWSAQEQRIQELEELLRRADARAMNLIAVLKEVASRCEACDTLAVYSNYSNRMIRYFCEKHAQEDIRSPRYEIAGMHWATRAINFYENRKVS